MVCSYILLIFFRQRTDGTFHFFIYRLVSIQVFLPQNVQGKPEGFAFLLREKGTCRIKAILSWHSWSSFPGRLLAVPKTAQFKVSLTKAYF